MRHDIELISEAENDLRWLTGHLRLSVTDTVNQAVQFYRFYHQERKKGGTLLLRDKNGRMYEVKTGGGLVLVKGGKQ